MSEEQDIQSIDPVELLESALVLLSNADRLMALASGTIGKARLSENEQRTAYRHALNAQERSSSLARTNARVVKDLGSRLGF